MDSDSPTPLLALRSVFAAIAAVFGLALVGFGIWALGGGIMAAWGLFNDPDSIAYFAKYFLETTNIAAHLPEGGEGLAHYASWLAVILLLLVIGKLGFWAIASGARLLDATPRRGDFR